MSYLRQGRHPRQSAPAMLRCRALGNVRSEGLRSKQLAASATFRVLVWLILANHARCKVVERQDVPIGQASPHHRLLRALRIPLGGLGYPGATGAENQPLMHYHIAHQNFNRSEE
jgi:hypothetical protein